MPAQDRERILGKTCRKHTISSFVTSVQAQRSASVAFAPLSPLISQNVPDSKDRHLGHKGKINIWGCVVLSVAGGSRHPCAWPSAMASPSKKTKKEAINFQFHFHSLVISVTFVSWWIKGSLFFNNCLFDTRQSFPKITVFFLTKHQTSHQTPWSGSKGSCLHARGANVMCF